MHLDRLGQAIRDKTYGISIYISTTSQARGAYHFCIADLLMALICDHFLLRRTLLPHVLRIAEDLTDDIEEDRVERFGSKSPLKSQRSGSAADQVLPNEKPHLNDLHPPGHPHLPPVPPILISRMIILDRHHQRRWLLVLHHLLQVPICLVRLCSGVVYEFGEFCKHVGAEVDCSRVGGEEAWPVVEGFDRGGVGIGIDA